MIEDLKMYKDVEDNKAAYILGVAGKGIYALSCPSFGDEYRAMIMIKYKDEHGKEIKYRYNLLTGKQVLIEDEYSTLNIKFLRELEKLLTINYHSIGSDNNYSLYQTILHTIDKLNQNTEDWVSVVEDINYANIPKFSNRRKPRSNTTSK